MPRRLGRRTPERLDPNLTPLLDVVLQLITFFMMLIHFGTQIEGATESVRLPIAPSALPSSELGLDRLVVAIGSQGQLLSEGVAYTGRTAEHWWADQAKRRREGQKLLGGPADELTTLVVIRADRAVPYGVVRKAVAKAQGLGFARFTLVALRETDR
jgi:biopolymer transport protein ExbD